MNRLKELKHQQGSTVLADNNYSYNPANQISGIAELSDTKTFGYDTVDRLTSMTSPTLTPENYSFDEVGNRTSSHLSSSYGYSENNRLRETETIGKINYDYNGNPTEIDRLDSSTLFTWDYENRMAIANNDEQITFTYDALGRRVKRLRGDEKTFYTYDGQDVIMDNVSNVNSVITKYQNGLGIDSKLKLKTGTVSKYFLQDHLGSTTALTNSSGSVIESATYDSFGNSTGNLSTRYGYTGREFDADLGLQYSRARWYDATLGRFISEDPIGLNGGINQYSYVDGNPQNFVDPSGLEGGGFGSNFADWNDERTEYARDAYKADPQHWVYNATVDTGADIALGISDMFRVGNGTGHAIYDCDDNIYGRAAYIAADVTRASALFSVIGGGFARNLKSPIVETLETNPFKGKTPTQIDEMFTKKGFDPRGPDPVNGKGGYVNPKTNRSYHIDEKNSFGEPPHVDVNRPRNYGGSLPKRKFPM
jgi:RHS repeat-associated protein